ncbi:helix-turn-helix transcriptional regulator [Streptomyces albidoflavus]|uniref:helix-turn-helix domain-containing protein n=1 Tax=Streptomyces albidoflavus TaxID=1886 RepID=UPI0033D820AD
MTNYADESAHALESEKYAHEERERLLEELAEDGTGPIQPDPVADATTGQLGDVVDSETLASWNLRRIREVLGVSQQQLSARLADTPGGARLSQSQIAKIERGERPWRVNEMFDIARALGVDYLELFRSQMRSDDAHLTLLAAKFAHQHALARAQEAYDAWVEAEEKAFAAGTKLLNTSLVTGIMDEQVVSLLEMRAVRAQRAAARSVEPLTSEQLEERLAHTTGKEEWVRLRESLQAEQN